jgi:uncharacterized protein YpmB
MRNKIIFAIPGVILLIILPVWLIVGQYLDKAEATETTEQRTEATELITEEVTTEEVTTESPVYSGITVTAIPENVREAKRQLEEKKIEEKTEEPERTVPAGGHLTRSGGVYYFNGHKETWYSTNEAAGQNTAVPIPGKHVDENGIIRDGDGFVCVASSDHAFYSIVETSWGLAKVYDCGCSHGMIDIYTSW